MAIHEVFPYLRAKSAEDAIAFYAKAFGAQEKFRLVEPSGRIGHAALDPDGNAPMALHLHVDDADATIAAAVAAGAHVTRALQDQFYGERSGRIRDPFGYDWLIGHTIETVEPDEMQRRYTALMSGNQ
ncbi:MULTISPECIES: VOC family protein [Burkholderia]|uniref:VOC family protein n=2 Tax=Burkholderiaceae TaxID=119060 RepID=UPI000052E5FE|nr:MULTISPECIES: VOC family protein [Burkholderia]EKS9841505.1 VOC family protein [Burkholderia cepacia]BEV49471.1 Dot/Icm type IV secretion system effector PhnB [Burkholderia contaminans]ABK11148.1 Glyoxalase/bleomycin resistance protein/dioxygenase [Burkholderia cenocepacia HI2424]AQQ24351.1 glyxoylase [Burkholderia cenocepacia]AQT52849.1 glyxoylase [Burkholderia cenocepacia]